MLARPKAILCVDNSVCVCVSVCVSMQQLSLSVLYLVTPVMGNKVQEKYKSTEMYMTT